MQDNVAPPPPSHPSRKFAQDQVVKGNVSIKKIRKHMYRITFIKIGKFLMYQVWDKDNAGNNNKRRLVYYMFAKTWVELFRQIQESNNKNDELVFTPTTTMETEDGNYAFVIHKACMNSCGHIVFTVSTKEISLQNNTSKKLTQLPEGKSNNVRFDIDYPSKENGYVQYNVSDCGYGGIRMYCCGGSGSGSFCGYWLDDTIRDHIWNTYPKAIYPNYEKAPSQDSGPPPVDYNWDITDISGTGFWTQEQMDSGYAASVYKIPRK